MTRRRGPPKPRTYRNAACGWAEKERVLLRTYEPGWYFPEWDEGKQDAQEYPDRIHFAWELPADPRNGVKARVRRVTYELGPVGPATAPGRTSRHFDRKVDAQRWLDEVTASVLTGQYVDSQLAKKPFKEYAEGWRRSRPHRSSTARAVEQAEERTRAAVDKAYTDGPDEGDTGPQEAP